MMNLRNISEAGVSPKHQAKIERAFRHAQTWKTSRVLPFRFVSAAKHAPQFAQALSDAMELCVDGELGQDTAILIDISGSMDSTISDKGTLLRWEAAGALAVMARAQSKSARVFVYSGDCQELKNLRGLGLLEAIGALPHGGTNTELALRKVQATCPSVHRVILITDEQAHDGIHKLWAKHGYIINVAPYKPGLELTGGWVRINGWSERVLDWMHLHEQEEVSDGGQDNG